MPHAPPQPDKAPESAPVLTLERAALRREKIAAREDLTPEEHRHRSQAVETHLKDLLQSHRPWVLAFYWPIRAEFDCRSVVQQLIVSGVRACLPRVIAPDTALEFRAWQAGSEMLVDRYGIGTPAAGELLTPDVVLLPVNAFDAAGYRLGYGRGYFDRTLASLSTLGQKPLAVGIGFELARVPSISPAPHDFPLDVIVTEAGAQWFSPRQAGLNL